MSLENGLDPPSIPRLEIKVLHLNSGSGDSTAGWGPTWSPKALEEDLKLQRIVNSDSEGASLW